DLYILGVVAGVRRAPYRAAIGRDSACGIGPRDPVRLTTYSCSRLPSLLPEIYGLYEDL
ncbi:hypothetical protein HAX54_046362, partial [Datura stramonium]|nr:hypothetical protein [Datura stramonium]